MPPVGIEPTFQTLRVFFSAIENRRHKIFSCQATLLLTPALPHGGLSVKYSMTVSIRRCKLEKLEGYLYPNGAGAAWDRQAAER